MLNDKHISKLEQALDRTVDALAACNPGTEEYTRLLDGTDRLQWMLRNLKNPEPCETDFTCKPSPVEPAGHPDPVGEPGEPGVPEVPVVKLEDMEVAAIRERIVPEELRAALAEAKKKGVVISDLISSLGAKNFSALKDDQDKLWELKGLLDKALKELGV